MSFATKQSGFSLIEMLVSISVLLIVIVGPMTVTSRVAKSSSYATEQVQAFFLAQEGLEIVEKIRDDLLLQHFNSGLADPWATFTNPNGTNRRCFATAGCGVDWSSATTLSSIYNCGVAGNCTLKYNPTAARSRYTHSTAGNPASTPYTRVIRLSTVAGGEAVLVTATVTWRTGSIAAEQRVETSTYLYNIYAKP